MSSMMRQDNIETVLIEDIHLSDAGAETQLREQTNEEVVQRYAEDMKNGDQFPAVELVPVGDGNHYIADGWHRILACQRIGRGIVDAIIMPMIEGQGALQAAKRFGVACQPEARAATHPWRSRKEGTRGPPNARLSLLFVAATGA
jgi:hypothetical protein